MLGTADKVQAVGKDAYDGRDLFFLKIVIDQTGQVSGIEWVIVDHSDKQQDCSLLPGQCDAEGSALVSFRKFSAFALPGQPCADGR